LYLDSRSGKLGEFAARGVFTLRPSRQRNSSVCLWLNGLGSRAEALVLQDCK